MSDIFSKSKRTQIMSRVRATETKPEIKIRKLIFSWGFRYRKNVKTLPGKPDIVLPKYRTVIFVNGCFWHGHKNCEAATLPKSNKEYWIEKIQKNMKRDARNILILRKEGWQIIVIWECEIKNILSENSSIQKMFIKRLKQ